MGGSGRAKGGGRRQERDEAWAKDWVGEEAQGEASGWGGRHRMRHLGGGGWMDVCGLLGVADCGLT